MHIYKNLVVVLWICKLITNTLNFDTFKFENWSNFENWSKISTLIVPGTDVH